MSEGIEGVQENIPRLSTEEFDSIRDADPVVGNAEVEEFMQRHNLEFDSGTVKVVIDGESGVFQTNINDFGTFIPDGPLPEVPGEAT